MKVFYCRSFNPRRGLEYTAWKAVVILTSHSDKMFVTDTQRSGGRASVLTLEDNTERGLGEEVRG
jgi:hypothetical protein